MAFCSACGAHLVQGEAFCPECGVAVDGSNRSASATPSTLRRGRLVLIVVAVLVGFVLAGGAVLLLAQSHWLQGGSASTGGSALTTPTAGGGEASSTTTQPSTTTESKPPATKPSSTTSKLTANDVTHQPTFIVKTGVADGGGSTITLDYILYLSGAAAEKAAKAHGDTVENDYYIVNDNKMLRTFPISSAVVIVLHPANGPQFHRTFTLAEFKALMSSHTAAYGDKNFDWSPQTPYYVNVKNGKVTRIEQQWVP